MGHSIGTTIKRRKELILLLCALVVGALAVNVSLSGWLEKENWGEPVTTRNAGAGAALPKVLLPDLSLIWEDGGRNPFGDVTVALESGGKAHIPLPPPPPLRPEMPPPPMVKPIDFLTEGGR